MDAELNFSILTETWISKENEKRIKNDLIAGYGIEIISKKRTNNKGGGVAIAWKNGRISLEKHSFFTGTFEIVAVKGKVAAAKRNMYIFAVYYPPSMKADDVQKMNVLICEEIDKIKTGDENAIIIIGGDFNKKECSMLSTYFPDVNYVHAPPTRGLSYLDSCYTNADVIETKTLPPLSTIDGRDSDHMSLGISLRIVRRKMLYERVTYRKVTKTGEDRFCTLMNEFDWSCVTRLKYAEDMTNGFHAIVERFKDECFPLKVRKRREDEDPWITDYLRKLGNKKRREYGKNGKSNRWHQLTELWDVRLRESREAYYDREVNKITESKDKRSLAYTALKNLRCPEKPKSWSLADLSEGVPIEEYVEEVADFFCAVSNENSPLKPSDKGRTYDRPLYNITPNMIVERVKESKRPNSTVPGDIPPKLLLRVVCAIAETMAAIFNAVPRDDVWPSAWKREYQTIIPKKPNPKDLSQVRNLSCTNFFSKVLESFVIDSLRTEISFSELQYGGLKGSGTDQFLAEVWNNIHETIEDPTKAVALMSVDFSKAFNRLSHAACLGKMREKYASNQSLSLVYSFLQGRKMAIRSGATLSTFRDVNGGSPQGTKLGNILFCLTIDDITIESDIPIANNESPEYAIPEEYRPVDCSTPFTKDMDDSFNPNPFGFRRRINVVDDTVDEELWDPRAECETWEIGYIDDINVGETLELNEAAQHITTERTCKEIRAVGCENMYETIKNNGFKVGLRLNPLKTQLLCFSGSKNSTVTCQAVVDGKMLTSGEELKILGFMFGNRPTVHRHIEYTHQKFTRSVWTIRHLKKANLKPNLIVAAYCSLLRPILEFSSNIYGPMLTTSLSEKIESCQKRILKIIFGYERTYEEMLREAKIESLKIRRERNFKKFAKKMSESARFSSKWLPKYNREEEGTSLRSRKIFIEYKSRTDRMYNSPIAYMRRTLNNE